MKVIENEFVVKAGRGAFRKARKKAFALLITHGYRNYISVEVCCKRVIKESIWQLGVGVIYNCTLWIEKHTNIIRLYETYHYDKFHSVSSTKIIPKNHPWFKNFEF